MEILFVFNNFRCMPEAIVYRENTGIIIPLVIIALILVALILILGWKLRQQNKLMRNQGLNGDFECTSGERGRLWYKKVRSNNEINQNKNVEIQMNTKNGDGFEANKSENTMNNIQ